MSKKSKKNLKIQTDFLGEMEYEKIKETDDSALVKMVLKKSPYAYREIERRYQKKLFTYLYHLVGNREETEDILQNVFVKVYNNIKSFDTKRKFSSWIYRIAHNEAINFLKKRNKRRFISWEDIIASKDKLETSSEEKTPVENWISKEVREEVQGALDRLPRKYKEVLVLRYFLDKSYEDIGEILKKPVNTVGTLINRAKKKLLEVINDH